MIDDVCEQDESKAKSRKNKRKLMENLKSQLEGVGTVAIAGHVRPDGTV